MARAANVKLSFHRNSDGVWLDFDYTPGGVAMVWTGCTVVVEVRTGVRSGDAAADAAAVLVSRMTSADGTVVLGAGGNVKARVSKNPAAANTSSLRAGTYWFDVRVTNSLGERMEPLLLAQVEVEPEVGEAS